MKEFLVYAFTIGLGAVLFGLTMYSFYIVLTSKDDKKINESAQEATKPLNKDRAASKTKPSKKSPHAA